MVQVRYYSRSGNTKTLASAIAEGAGTEAVSIDAPNAAITEKTDVLFIGGALYAYGLDKKLSEYISKLDAGLIDKAVVFSTSWISKHALDLIKKGLKAKGINVVEETFYAKNMPSSEQLAAAKKFAGGFVK